MRFLLFLFAVFGLSSAASVLDPSDCTEFPCMIFEDNFNFLDNDVWTHEISMSGGGNAEFEVYVNNRSVTYVRDGYLFIKPNLVSDWKADDNFVYEEELDLWGQNGKNEVCSGPMLDGCKKTGSGDNIVNPVMSGRLRTLGAFSFQYGRIEARVKLPRGAWLWPAVWLLPEYFPYGEWPASGEIDIVEARGNDIYGDINNTFAGSTLHWGPYLELNRYPTTHADYTLADQSSFTDDFHTWSVEWTSEHIRYTLDGEEIMYVDPVTSFWDYGNFTDVSDTIDNPWEGRDKMAPFDQKFYFVVNLAIGGSGGYFPDDITPCDPPKSWSNDDPAGMKAFWDDRDSWLPTWTQGEGKISENAALQVDYLRVYKMSSDQITQKG